MKLYPNGTCMCGLDSKSCGTTGGVLNHTESSDDSEGDLDVRNPKWPIFPELTTWLCNVGVPRVSSSTTFDHESGDAAWRALRAWDLRLGR